MSCQALFVQKRAPGIGYAENFIIFVNTHGFLTKDEMKRFATVLALLCSFFAASYAQNSDYNRNSLSVLYVSHNDGYDQINESYLRSNNPGGDKYDVNAIGVYSVPSSSSRLRLQQNSDQSESVQARTYMGGNSASVSGELSKADVPSKIVGFWFNRSDNGLMDVHVINERAEYNATDRTYNVANSQALGQYLLQSGGASLIGRSYVLVVDQSMPEISYEKNSDGKITTVKASAMALGYLYKLAFSDSDLQKVYDAWIYTDDTQEAVRQKKADWDRLSFSLSLLTIISEPVSVSASADKNPSETELRNNVVRSSGTVLIEALEKKVADWQVRSGIYGTNPVTAKIGKKEGLENMDRYEVLEYVADENGNVTTRRKGWIRATEVYDNRYAATGQGGFSRFYQIEGGKLEPGMQIHQNHSMNFDVKALYYGGSDKGFGLELDYFYGMKTNMGMVNHIRVGGAYGSYGAGFTANEEYQLTDALTFITVRMGYGYGIRPLRFVEFVPGASLIADSYSSPGESSENEDTATFLAKTGWGLELGVDCNVSLYYPVKLNAGVFYDQYLFGGAIWQAARDVLKQVGTSRSGLTYRVGLVYEF